MLDLVVSRQVAITLAAALALLLLNLWVLSPHWRRRGLRPQAPARPDG